MTKNKILICFLSTGITIGLITIGFISSDTDIKIISGLCLVSLGLIVIIIDSLLKGKKDDKNS